MKHKGLTILLLTVLAFGLFYYIGAQFMPEQAWFRCTAFEHLLQGIAVYAAVRKLQGNTVLLETISSISMCLMFSNYLDEILFNPLIWQWNEVIFGLMAITIPILKNAREIIKIINRDR